MTSLNDPIFEFIRDDPLVLMELNEDQVDPRLPWSFAGTRERDRLAGALRQLADLFTSRHDLPIPKDGYVRLDVIADGERRVAEIAHGPDGYLFKVLPGAFESATSQQDTARSASKLAAADSPAADSGSHSHARPGQRQLTTATPRSEDDDPRTRRRDGHRSSGGPVGQAPARYRPVVQPGR
jgi:hypothetical protein